MYLSNRFFIIEDAFACHFLLKQGALPTVIHAGTGYSPLHFLAGWKNDEVAAIAKLILSQGSGPNVVGDDGW